MDKALRASKRTIRSFIQNHYSDEALCQALAHARDGKLSYYSCCCLVGIPTADHALKGSTGVMVATKEPHYRRSIDVNKWTNADAAYGRLFVGAAEDWGREREHDAIRRRRLIPILKAEIRRRDRLASTAVTERDAETSAFESVLVMI